MEHFFPAFLLSCFPDFLIFLLGHFHASLWRARSVRYVAKSNLRKSAKSVDNCFCNSSRATDCIRMARHLVAGATQPPCRDGWATRPKARLESAHKLVWPGLERSEAPEGEERNARRARTASPRG